MTLMELLAACNIRIYSTVRSTRTDDGPPNTPRLGGTITRDAATLGRVSACGRRGAAASEAGGRWAWRASVGGRWAWMVTGGRGVN